MSEPVYEVYPADLTEGRWTVPYEQLRSLAIGEVIQIEPRPRKARPAKVVDHNADGFPIVEVITP